MLFAGLLCCCLVTLISSNLLFNHKGMHWFLKSTSFNEDPHVISIWLKGCVELSGTFDENTNFKHFQDPVK